MRKRRPASAKRARPKRRGGDPNASGAAHIRAAAAQGLAVENLVAGAHTHPSILLAKDLYAEKLRSMRLQRELSSSRVALRRSQQKAADAQRSAAQLRRQASKSVWSLINRAARRTQRMPPLDLSESAPRLAGERAPVALIRAAASNPTLDVPAEILADTIAPSTNNTLIHAAGIKRFSTLKSEGKLGLRREWHRRKQNSDDLPTRATLILSSPSSTALKWKRRRRRREVEWDVQRDMPQVPQPLPVFDELMSRPASGGSGIAGANGGDAGSTTSSRSGRGGGRRVRPSTAPLSRRHNASRVASVVPQARDCAQSVNGAGPWPGGAFPGQASKQAMGKLALPKDGAVGAGAAAEQREEEAGAALRETRFLGKVGDSALEFVNAGASSSADGDNYSLPSSSLTTRGRFAARAAYDVFASMVKAAARQRRRLLSVVLGSIHLAIDRKLEAVAEQADAEYRADGGSHGNRKLPDDGGAVAALGSDQALAAHVAQALATVKQSKPELSTTAVAAVKAAASARNLFVGRDTLDEMVSSWRLGDSLRVDAVDRLCAALPRQQGAVRIDLRELEGAMRLVVGNVHKGGAKSIVALTQSIKKTPDLMTQAPPMLPGSKLDRGKTYRVPKYTKRTRLSRRRWDSDEFDATSLYIVPILGRQNLDA